VGTAALPTSLLPIWDQENPIWQQHLAAVSDLEGPHFHTGMTSLARYVQHLFNLQHNIARTGMQQRTCLTAYKESAILRSGACPPSEQVHELKEVYYRLGNAEHGWNHTRMLLDITHEEVETRTRGIIHLEHHMEVQDAELEERAQMIANLEQ
jgi:hypothetical protein